MRRVRACGNLRALTNRLERIYSSHNCLLISVLENLALALALAFVMSLHFLFFIFYFLFLSAVIVSDEQKGLMAILVDIVH